MLSFDASGDLRRHLHPREIHRERLKKGRPEITPTFRVFLMNSFRILGEGDDTAEELSLDSIKCSFRMGWYVESEFSDSRATRLPPDDVRETTANSARQGTRLLTRFALFSFHFRQKKCTPSSVLSVCKCASRILRLYTNWPRFSFCRIFEIHWQTLKWI